MRGRQACTDAFPQLCSPSGGVRALVALAPPLPLICRLLLSHGQVSGFNSSPASFCQVAIPDPHAAVFSYWGGFSICGKFEEVAGSFAIISASLLLVGMVGILLLQAQ